MSASNARTDAGFDYTKSADDQLGWLQKYTLAPQITSGNEFFSRPALRAFVTYARWPDDFEGRVGGSAFHSNTNGLTYGVQAESWW